MRQCPRFFHAYGGYCQKSREDSENLNRFPFVVGQLHFHFLSQAFHLLIQICFRFLLYILQIRFLESDEMLVVLMIEVSCKQLDA